MNPTDTVPADTEHSDPQAAALAQIPVLRGQIDALDAAIAALIVERTAVSRRVQAARISAGGTRVELGRERVVHQHYRDTLGPEGGSVADAVLRVGRGAR